MDKRPNVLETVRPTDALGRLSARTSGARAWLIALVVVIALIAVFILGAIIHGTASGTKDIRLPSVLR